MRGLRFAAVTAATTGLLAILITVGAIGHVRPGHVSASPPQAELSAAPTDLPSPDPPAPQPSPDILEPAASAPAPWPTSRGIAAALAPYVDDLGAHAGIAVAGKW